MRNNKILKKMSLFLAASMMILTLAGCSKKPVTENQILLSELRDKEYVQQEYAAAPGSVSKQETVYVSLTPAGHVRRVNVTDWIHTDAPQVRVEDVSNLSEIRNVKTLTNPVFGEGNIYWDMDTTDLYYSGVSEEKPPVKFTIQYYLDGTEMHPEDMAGKSGEVTIVIKAENTLKKTVSVMGETYEVSSPMLMAGGVILPEGTFTEVVVDNGTTISDGSKQVVFFTGFPGIDESLGLSKLNAKLPDNSFYSDTYTIMAHTDCFEMGNMMFAVMPFASITSLADKIGGGTFPSTIESAKSLIGDLVKIQEAMKGLDLDRIVNMLYGDSNRIEELMNAVSEASVLYNENEKLIKTMNKYMTDENMAKLDKLAADLEKTDLEAVSDTLSDPALKRLLQMLPELSESLSDVSTLAKDLDDLMPMFEALSKDMEDPEIQKSLKNLPDTIERLKKVLDVFEKNRELLETLGAAAESGATEQLQEVVQTAGKYAGLGVLTDKQAEVLSEKMKVWIDFGSEYKIFTQRTALMDSSVMFTYKTDAVKAPEEVKRAIEEKAEGGNKITNWFKKLFK